MEILNTFIPGIHLHHYGDTTGDTTDNKSDNSLPNVLKDSITATVQPIRSINEPLSRGMNESLSRELERRKTFENRWPLTFMDQNVLAKTGMYYTGSSDNVKCYFCGVEIGRWETTDHPVTEHMRWSPNCPLLRRRHTINVPVDIVELDSILPPPSYDVCGASDSLDIRPNAFAESSITPTISSPTSSTTTTNIYPDHPEYAIETARLRSFSEWPRTMKQKPQELSEAGFFYTGIGDRVKCFSCGGGLKDWDEIDDPWEQHALWLSNCHYLKLMKGKNYVDSVIAKYKSDKAAEVKTEIFAKDQSNCNGIVEVRKCEIETTSSKGTSEQCCRSTDNVEQTTTSFDDHHPQLKMDEKKISDDKLCKICYVGEYNTAFLPCGHVVACAKCASSVTKCPVCRKPFTDVMRVYFS